ncbi:MAG: inositol monophosphatase family protein [Candidatus Jorgensenbacteria bacterium]|nr:inositol monophosphatase family protein [Candidatus Jorgensenbacteria bacterium]
MKKKEFNPKTAISRLRLLLLDIGEKVLKMRKSGGNMGIRIKTGVTDIVTRADNFSEEKIVSHIKKLYPGHRIRGEEKGVSVESNSEWEWIIDPIDGTSNYSGGMDFFGISVGLYRNGIGQLGMINYPALKKLVYAIKGEGAWMNGKRITIQRADKKALKDSLIAAGIMLSTAGKFERLQSHSRNIVMFGSFTCDTLLFLEEKIGANIHTGATPYDIAAARIIVREAGGVSSGIESAAINIDNEKIPIIFARSQKLAQELRELLRN